MDLLDDGKSVPLEIDIQGAMQVKERFSDAVFIYICTTSSTTELSERLHNPVQMLKKLLINDCH